MTLSIDSFALKIIKKSEELAFSNKAKILDISIPSKVKSFIEENLATELNHLKKRHKLDFNLIADNNLIIPEYKIDLLNKNKKIIKKIENLNRIQDNFFARNQYRKDFKNKKFNNKFNKNRKFKKNYNFHSKSKKNYFENKKTANY